MKISVIGAGKWGQALFHAYSQKNQTTITSRTKRDIPNFVTLEEALQSEYLVITIPAQKTREWLENKFIDNGQKILVGSKGIEAETGKFLNEVYEEFVEPERLCYLSGPSFAAEVMKNLPTALKISSEHTPLAKKWVQALPDFIKGYSDNDIIAAEVGGAYKNVIAIAGGVCDGLELGNNARAALISRGLVEMERFGRHFGSRTENFLSLGGAGDLFLTASSKLSRNYRVGLGLSEGKPIDKIVEELGEVAEGVPTTKALKKIADKMDIYLPIMREVHSMLFENKNPRTSVEDLLK